MNKQKGHEVDRDESLTDTVFAGSADTIEITAARAELAAKQLELTVAKDAVCASQVRLNVALKAAANAKSEAERTVDCVSRGTKAKIQSLIEELTNLQSEFKD